MVAPRSRVRPASSSDWVCWSAISSVPAVGRSQQADDVEQRALARTRRPLERHELRLAQRQRNAVQHLGLHRRADVVALVDVGELQDGGGWGGHAWGYCGRMGVGRVDVLARYFWCGAEIGQNLTYDGVGESSLERLVYSGGWFNQAFPDLGWIQHTRQVGPEIADEHCCGISCPYRSEVETSSRTARQLGVEAPALVAKPCWRWKVSNRPELAV
jgi:hypothetical protein